VYLTNPQEIVPEHVLAAQLCSAGVLKVRRKDIVARWPDLSGGDLSHLLHQPDPRWAAFNVLGKWSLLYKMLNLKIRVQR
jgi:hypothetical protein